MSSEQDRLAAERAAKIASKIVADPVPISTPSAPTLFAVQAEAQDFVNRMDSGFKATLGKLAVAAPSIEVKSSAPSPTVIYGSPAQGIPGGAGTPGTPGTTGATGPAGAMGLTGATGPAGASGTTGSTGATGAQGAMGSVGLTGATGPAGPAGPTGSTGAAGSSGAAGATGATGTGLAWVVVTAAAYAALTDLQRADATKVYFIPAP